MRVLNTEPIELAPLFWTEITNWLEKKGWTRTFNGTIPDGPWWVWTHEEHPFGAEVKTPWDASMEEMWGDLQPPVLEALQRIYKRSVVEIYREMLK